MRNRLVVVCIAAWLMVPVVAAAQSEGVDWRFGLGGTYTSGFKDVTDYYTDAYGLDVNFVLPVGVTFAMTVQIPHGDAIASIPTFGIGPAGMILTNEKVYGYGYGYYDSSSYSSTYVDIPLTASYGFKFLPHASVGPYVRGGVAYHVALGDLVESSSPGGFVAAGVELFQKKRVSLAFEASYDASTVTFKGRTGYFYSLPATELKTGNTMFTVKAVF